LCKVDTASTFEEAEELLIRNFHRITVVDIVGVRGYELLDIAKTRDIPALMLTAHTISKDNLKKSFEKGASFYVRKDEINSIAVFLADILEAREKNKSVFVRWEERLSGFCDRRFRPNWKDEDPEFWDSLLKY
jgi:CheY-like chemotaxis protein